jgi:hypothetical protein
MKEKEYELPDFPILFETVGKFLAVARVSKSQKRKLEDARIAFHIIAKVLYSRQATSYPCGKKARISAMPLANGHPCTSWPSKIPITVSWGPVKLEKPRRSID